MRGGARWWWKRSTRRSGASCRVSSRAALCERRARSATTRAPLIGAPPDRIPRKDLHRLTEGRSPASLAAVAAKASEEARAGDPKLAAPAVGPPTFTADGVEGPGQQRHPKVVETPEQPRSGRRGAAIERHLETVPRDDAGEHDGRARAGQRRLDAQCLDVVETAVRAHVSRQPTQRLDHAPADDHGPAEIAAMRGNAQQVLVPQMQLDGRIARLKMGAVGQQRLLVDANETDANETVLAVVELDDPLESAHQPVDPADQPAASPLRKLRFGRHRREDSDDCGFLLSIASDLIGIIAFGVAFRARRCARRRAFRW